MSLDLDYKQLTLESTGSTTYVPENDLAKLMYYLNCVFSVIQYYEDNSVNKRLTDFKNSFN